MIFCSPTLEKELIVMGILDNYTRYSKYYIRK